MYGIPENLSLTRLVGKDFNLIGLGNHQIQFHITDIVAISVEGHWELRDSEGTVIDSNQEQEPSKRDVYRVHKIIGVPIVRFTLDAPQSLTLFFETGYSLTIYDDSEQYESFSIHFVGQPNIYV